MEKSETGLNTAKEDGTMPPGAGKRAGSAQNFSRLNSKVSLSASVVSNDASHSADERKRLNKFKRSPKSTSEISEGQLVAEKDAHAQELEIELHNQLFDALKDCSRQRLRSLRMSLRRFGNPDSRIGAKELIQVFQENNIKVSSRTFQMLVDVYEDTRGIDYEKLWKSFVMAQGKTGRDSVMAQNKRNDLESQVILTAEEKDEDLIRRISIQLDGAVDEYDLQKLRNNFQGRDKDKSGQVKRDETEAYLQENHVPVFGALLTILLNRCDMDRSGQVSWPELMSFLEKAHHNVTGEEMIAPEADINTPVTALAADPQTEATDQTKPVNSPKAPKRGKSVNSRSKKRTDAKTKKVSSASKSPATRIKDRSNKPDEAAESRSEDSSAESSVLASHQDSVSDDKIPEPIAKDMVKAAFNKVISETDNENINTDKNTNKDNDKVSSKNKQGNSKESSKDDLKKSSNIKATSGFLSSMRSLLKVKKKDDKKSTESAVPLIQLEQNKQAIIEEAEPHDTTESRSHPVSARSQTSRTSVPASERTSKPPHISMEDSAQTKKNNQNQFTVSIKGKQHVFYTPDGFQMSAVNTDPPQERLKLEWIYGYRGNDCRSNIYVLKSEEILYYIGPIVVLYNRETHHQRHYREHTQDIRCIAVHPNGVTVATGQNSGSSSSTDGAHVRLWRSDTLQTLHILGMGTLTKSITCISFSRGQAAAAASLSKTSQQMTSSEERVCAVDDSDGHSLSVWDVSTGKLLAQSGLGLEVVCGIDFTPKDSSLVAIIGKEHIGWWRIDAESESIALQQNADHQKYLRAKYVICLLHTDKGDLITGDSNGTVYVWGYGGNIITNLIKHGHDGPVFTLLYLRGTLLTGGRDGIIYSWTWNKNMDQSGKLEIPRPEGGVRMVQVHKERLLIGTTTNSILTATLAATALRCPLSGVVLDKIALTMGHFGDICGVCAADDPDITSLVFTAGLDGILCLYDTIKKQALWKFFLKGTKISCIDANTTDGFIAIGTKDSIIVLSIEKDEHQQVFLSEICRQKIIKEKLTTIKLAPDCESLAAVDVSGMVYIVGLRDGQEGEEDEVWDVLQQWQAHNTAITGLDWSLDIYADTYIIRTSSKEMELAYWNTDTGEKLNNVEDLRNLKWFTHHCKLTYGTAGIWFTKQAEEAQVQAVDVNVHKSLVAMGDSHGYLSLMRYPCPIQGTFSNIYRGMRKVQHMKFTMDGKRIVYSCTKDMALKQCTIG